MRGRDEGFALVGARKDDVAWLIADEQGTGDVGLLPVEPDDADAIGEVVDDPGFLVRARCHGHRFQAHRHRNDVFKVTVMFDLIHFQLGIGGVGRQ